MELGDKVDVPVGVLSYGDQKRVEVARALCTEPDLLLLDEPVAGMNAEETRRMAAAILEIRPALGISIVLVEHDMGMVMGIADRVTVLDFGRLIADGTPGRGAARPRGHPGLPRLRRRDRPGSAPTPTSPPTETSPEAPA